MKSRPSTIISTEVLRQSGAPGSLHVFELSHEQARDLRLVVLAEIEISDKDNEIIIEDLVREIEQRFFNSQAVEFEYAFENALAKANIKVKDILLSKPKNWLSRIHVAVLAIAGSEVHMASVGMAHAFLVHQDKITDVLKTPDNAHAPNPVKLFTNIVSGTLALDTSLVLANESVLDYLSVERIRKCAQELDAPDALAALTELLGRAPSHKQFGLAVISRQQQTQSAPQAPIAAPGAEADEIEEFRAAEEEYEHVPPYRAEARESETPAKERFEAQGELAKTIAKKAARAGQAVLTFLLSAAAAAMEKTQRALKRGGPAARNAAKTAFASIKSEETRKYIWEKTKRTAAETARSMVHGHSRKRQAAGLAVVALILVFAGSITVRAYRQNREQRTAVFQTEIAGIEQKISEAEAALIYGNKIKSQALLAEVQTRVAELSREYPEQESRYQKIRDAVEALKNKGEQKQSITDVSIAATAIPAPLSSGASGLVTLASGGIFFYDGVAEKIAHLDAQNQLLLSLPLQNQGIESFRSAVRLENSELAAFAEDTVLIVDTEDETVGRQAFSYAPGDIRPFASYAGNVYTFSAGENRIIRYRRAGAGFTAAQDWLDQDYELATMRDIAVDGFIYLLDSQGTIHVFLRGAINSTIPWGAQELPGEYVRLYTTETGDVLYVLDPAHGRIVLIHKQGELLVQLVNPMLEGATDMVIGPDGKNLYTLAGDKIYRLGIPSY